MAKKATNTSLHKAKAAKNDEFYTQYVDIQKEVEAYLEYNEDVFRDKVVYCNCDDPYESNFFRYFVLNFEKLGLKQLITTSYKPSPIANTQLPLFGDDKTLVPKKERPKVTANRFIINSVGDIDGDGEFTLRDVAQQLRENKNNEWIPLDGNGDFRSEECIELFKQADIIITNPPFSLFREYVAQLFEYDKQFLIISNKNAITYKEIFPKIKENKMWVGNMPMSVDLLFIVPEYVQKELEKTGKIGSSYRIIDGQFFARSSSIWFTNLDHGKRHQPLSLMTMEDNKKFNKKVKKSSTAYKKYDNYNAIEVPFTDAIPSDYDGVMGVPISFLDKYNPDQFEILGHMVSTTIDEYNFGYPYVDGKKIYARILIKYKRG
ncbi:MAG: DNA methyltransferase [Ignavibacteria bacterium]|nr:DNA methyltransferase [Ignavibacteria bacterium]